MTLQKVQGNNEAVEGGSTFFNSDKFEEVPEKALLEMKGLFPSILHYDLRECVIIVKVSDKALYHNSTLPSFQVLYEKIQNLSDNRFSEACNSWKSDIAQMVNEP